MQIIDFIKTGLGYLLTLIVLIINLITLFKAIKNKNFNKVKELMISFIEEAEVLICKNGSTVDGTTKKEIVLSKIRNACNEFKVKFNENVWSNLVDEYVKFTLKVNQRPEDKNKLLSNNDVEEKQPVEVK